MVLVCHVEPGTVRGLELVFHPRHVEGISIALPRILEFADEKSIPMAFALTPAAMKEKQTDLSGHEAGVHLHPQDTQLREKLGREVTLASDCLVSYSPQDQATLIGTAKELFEQSEGYSPRVFVSGNWSESNTTLKLLVEAGFSHDGSPLPNHLSQCADWSRIRRLAQPYSPSPEDYQAPGSIDYLYLPVSQGLWGHYLTPEVIHLLGASYFKAALKEALIGGAELVHVFFHSPMAMNPLFLTEFTSVVEYAHDQLGIGWSLPSECEPGDGPEPKPFPPVYLAQLNWRLAKGFVGRGQLGKRLMGVDSAEASLSASTNEETRD